MGHRYFKTALAGLISAASLMAAVQPAFAVGEPKFGEAWIKGVHYGSESNALPTPGSQQPRFEVVKPADADSFGELVNGPVEITGAFFATMKKGYVWDTDIGIELRTVHTDWLAGHGSGRWAHGKV